MYSYLSEGLSKVAAAHGERLLSTKGNPISLGNVHCLKPSTDHAPGIKWSCKHNFQRYFGEFVVACKQLYSHHLTNYNGRCKDIVWGNQTTCAFIWACIYFVPSNVDEGFILLFILEMFASNELHYMQYRNKARDTLKHGFAHFLFFCFDSSSNGNVSDSTLV